MAATDPPGDRDANKNKAVEGNARSKIIFATSSLGAVQKTTEIAAVLKISLRLIAFN